MVKIITIVITFAILVKMSSAISSVTFNVVELGARSDGQTESTKSFAEAWAAACASMKPAVVYVPVGRYLVDSLHFRGKCNNTAITFRLDGTLVAASGYNADTKNWLLFEGVSGVTVRGGILDGRGSSLWACKADPKSCPTTIGATTLGFVNSKNVEILGVISLNSQMFHIVINGCENVRIQGVKVSAPGNSPNTDGIHVQLSSGVTIINTKISTGDDCISIGPGTTNLWIENILCGPGHGISIGSLAKDFEEAGVENVTVKTVTFRGTQNGVRIKAWGRASRGFVKNILFQHVTMVEVQNPIVIDQNYCPGNINCPGEVSGVKINDVTYEDIHGSSSTKVGIKFDCSKKNPCRGLKLQNVKLFYLAAAAEASCVNAGGISLGLIQPTNCFLH